MSLLDSGSTHNFLDAAMAMKLKLQIDTCKLLEVKVANGAVVETKGVCYGVQLLMQGIKFMVELNVIPFGGCEVVLGTQRLSTLGVIKWDFKLLAMQFTYSVLALPRTRKLAFSQLLINLEC